MVDEERLLTLIKVFENIPVRQVWYQGELWLCLPDVVAVFAGTKRASKYWHDLKKSIIEEDGYTELSARIGKLKFQLDNGRHYPMDAATITTVSRIIQSIRSPKAEDFKQWLADLAAQEFKAIGNPELAKERLRKAYERAGRSPTWIKLRLDGIEIRKKLTDEWQVRGIVNGWEYAVLTNRISEETFGIPTQSHRALKRLKKQDLREHYTDIEHALINLSEAAAHEFTIQRDSHGFEPIQQDAIDGGRVGGRARSDLESQGLKVVSDQNYLDTTKRKRIKEKRQKDDVQPQLFLQLEEGQE